MAISAVAEAISATPVIHYSVIAKASYVDNLEPSVPGARPRVSIEGDFVHARIR